ncbi:hypothetical protein TREES_T100010444 [Tupaia chinensis]|uniref:Uncharacterized protein n=1 Tax=Tupaia chinensis TaxID=246437 RepID=L9LE46_TUPCH|nr:hypothetical protein TREES_T100010444 [Tupaia chinensis]
MPFRGRSTMFPNLTVLVLVIQFTNKISIMFLLSQKFCSDKGFQDLSCAFHIAEECAGKKRIVGYAATLV